MSSRFQLSQSEARALAPHARLACLAAEALLEQCKALHARSLESSRGGAEPGAPDAARLEHHINVIAGLHDGLARLNRDAARQALSNRPATPSREPTSSGAREEMEKLAGMSDGAGAIAALLDDAVGELCDRIDQLLMIADTVADPVTLLFSSQTERVADALRPPDRPSRRPVPWTPE